MKNYRWVIVVALAAIIITTTTGWGFLVHKSVHQLAIYQLPKGMRTFFYHNINNLVDNSTRPDSRRSTDSTEATKHFIDLEAYGDSAAYKMPLQWADAIKMYTKDTLLKYGYVPYHIVYMKEKLTAAFRSRNADSILFYAADIGHYIADANVPLHTSINYDGQLSNQRGLHSLWESMVPEIEISNYTLRTKHKAGYLRHPDEAIMDAVRQANMLTAGVFAKEIEVSRNFSDSQKYTIRVNRGREYKNYTTAFATAYGASLQPTVNDQLINSANLIADFWYTSWADAGKPDLNGLITPSANRSEKKAYKKEFKSYKNNRLISDSLLRSMVSGK